MPPPLAPAFPPWFPPPPLWLPPPAWLPPPLEFAPPLAPEEPSEPELPPLLPPDGEFIPPDAPPEEEAPEDPPLLPLGPDGLGIEEGMLDPPPEAPPPLGMLDPLDPLLPPPLGMLELEPPDDPEDPPDEPDEPDDPPEGLGIDGGGMPLEEEDCWSAHPPIRNAETELTSVVWSAMTNSRLNEWRLGIAWSPVRSLRTPHQYNSSLGSKSWGASKESATANLNPR